MKDFGIIHTRFWEWAIENEVSDTAKLIAAYLLTCRHANSLGCFRIPYQYVSADLGYPIDRVSKGYSELVEKGFLLYCEQSKYVFLPKYLRWNPPQNYKHAKGIYNLALKLPSSISFADKILKSCEKYLFEYLNQDTIDTLYHTLSIGYAKGSDSVDIAYGNTDTDTSTDTSTDTDTDTNSSERCEHPSEPASDYQKNDSQSSPVVFEVPLSGKNTPMFPITQQMVDDWQEDFPAVDVPSELKKLIRWNKDNPKRRKTKNGVRRHISSWLGRAQDKMSSLPQISKPQNSTKNGWPLSEKGQPKTWGQIRAENNKQALQEAEKAIFSEGGV